MFAKKKGGGADPNQQLEPRMAAGRSDSASGLERQPSQPVRDPIRRTADYASQPVRRQAEQQRPSEPSSSSNTSEGKKLIVGSGIKLSGEIMACEKLVVEGEVEADLSDSQILEIAETGLFRGRAVVDEAFISGTFEGELTCRTRLTLRASGRVIGTLRYMEMEIERGGKVSGQIEEIDGRNLTAAMPAAPAEAPAVEESEEAESASPARAAAKS